MPEYFDLEDYSLYKRYSMYGHYYDRSYHNSDHYDDKGYSHYFNHNKIEKMKNTFDPKEIITRYGMDLTIICDRLNKNDLLTFIDYCNYNNIDISKNNNYILRWAAYYNKAEVVDLLLNNKYIDPKAENYYSIIKSITYNNNNGAVIKMINYENVDITFNNNSLLKTAILYKNNEIIDYIFNHPNFDINVGVDEIIRVSCEKGQIYILEKILKNDNILFKRALSYGLIKAVNYRNIDVVKLLLKSKHINLSYDANNAFRCALEKQLYEVCDLLIDDDRFNPSEYDYIVVNKIISHFKNDKEDKYLNKILKHKNILNGNLNNLMHVLLKTNVIKKFIIDNNIINLIDENTKNKLIENKLIPYYKGKVSERTL